MPWILFEIGFFSKDFKIIRTLNYTVEFIIYSINKYDWEDLSEDSL
jgi:hypothetical protein